MRSVTWRTPTVQLHRVPGHGPGPESSGPRPTTRWCISSVVSRIATSLASPTPMAAPDRPVPAARVQQPGESGGLDDPSQRRRRQSEHNGSGADHSRQPADPHQQLLDALTHGAARARSQRFAPPSTAHNNNLETYATNAVSQCATADHASVSAMMPGLMARTKNAASPMTYTG